MLKVIAYLDEIGLDHLESQRHSVRRWANRYRASVMAEFSDPIRRRSKLASLDSAIASCQLYRAHLLVANTPALVRRTRFIQKVATAERHGVAVFSSDLTALQNLPLEFNRLVWSALIEIGSRWIDTPNKSDTDGPALTEYEMWAIKYVDAVKEAYENGWSDAELASYLNTEENRARKTYAFNDHDAGQLRETIIRLYQELFHGRS